MSNTQSQIYALLVGSNDYSTQVGKLQGCLNDVEQFENYLKNTFDQRKLNIEVYDALYQNSGHDIAVSQASIQGVPDSRLPVPVKKGVSCHHLNYFVSEAGLSALGMVEW